jgi:hypothetical protein
MKLPRDFVQIYALFQEAIKRAKRYFLDGIEPRQIQFFTNVRVEFGDLERCLLMRDKRNGPLIVVRDDRDSPTHIITNKVNNRTAFGRIQVVVNGAVFDPFDGGLQQGGTYNTPEAFYSPAHGVLTSCLVECDVDSEVTAICFKITGREALVYESEIQPDPKPLYALDQDSQIACPDIVFVYLNEEAEKHLYELIKSMSHIYHKSGAVSQCICHSKYSSMRNDNSKDQ